MGYKIETASEIKRAIANAENLPAWFNSIADQNKIGQADIPSVPDETITHLFSVTVNGKTVPVTFSKREMDGVIQKFPEAEKTFSAALSTNKRVQETFALRPYQYV